MLPTSGELTRARVDLQAAMLPDTCNILHGTITRDDLGAATTTWGTADTSVACRLDAQSGKEALTADAVDPYHAYVLTLPVGATITATDYRIEHGGYTYEVKSVDLDKSWSWCKRAIVERV